MSTRLDAFGRIVAAVVVALLAGALPAAATAGANPPVLAGSVSDATNLSAAISVAVSGHYAYTTAYHAGELTAVDISNPASPTIAGESAPFLDRNLIGGSNVAIAGGDAFVVSKSRNGSSTSNDDGNGNSLTVLDIQTNPAQPTVLGAIRDTNKLFGSYGIAVSGNYAYVAYQGLLGGQPTAPDTSTGGFSVIDLTTMQIVANIDNGSLPAPYAGTNALEHATSVAISGHYAYVNAFYGARVTVIDISNPTAPAIVASLHDATNLGAVVDLVVQGNYLYAADQNNGTSPMFTVLDISNPLSPKVVATIVDAAHLGGAYRIRVRGNFAYESASSANGVAAIDISDPLHPRVAGSLINNTVMHRTTGLDLDTTGAYVIASSPLLSTESNSTYPPYPLQTGGGTATGTISVVRLDPNPIAVTIAAASEPTNPTTSTSASFSFSVNDDVAVVQCQLDGAPLGPCTTTATQQYTGLPPGPHTFTVQSTDAAGNIASDSYTWTVVVGSGAQNTSPPSISGTATLGQTLSAVPGSWSGTPTPTLSYAWDRCDQSGANCAAIGAAGPTYTLQRADVGATVVVVVTGSKSGGSQAVASPATAIVTGAPQSTAAPAVSGTATQGATLTASSGNWSGYPAPSLAYAWSRCNQAGTFCVAITGATASTYVATRGDVGYRLVVKVTATNNLGSAAAGSSQTSIVTGPPGSSVGPTVSGTPVQGNTLTGTFGTWTGYPMPTLSMTWQRCKLTGCAAIAGATSTTYTLTAADVGAQIRVVVTGTNSLGTLVKPSSLTAKVTSAATATMAGVRKPPKVRIVVANVGAGGLDKQFELILPKGMRFVGSAGALAHAIVIRDNHGRVVHGKITLRGGRLFIRLHRPLVPVRIRVDARRIVRAR